jgi:hypothetical protein
VPAAHHRPPANFAASQGNDRFAIRDLYFSAQSDPLPLVPDRIGDPNRREFDASQIAFVLNGGHFDYRYLVFTGSEPLNGRVLRDNRATYGDLTKHSSSDISVRFGMTALYSIPTPFGSSVNVAFFTSEYDLLLVHHGLVWVGKNAGGFFEG